MEQTGGHTGTLSVRVYASQAELPIEGATVVVTRRAPAGKYELVSVQVTDSSGLIRPVTVEAPPAGTSTEPNMAHMGEPFAVCDVWAEHPGYVMLQVEGVQIFCGVETMQEMDLMPLGRGQSSLERRQLRYTPGQEL